MIDTPFLVALKKDLTLSATNHYTDNYDVSELGPEPVSGQGLLQPVWRECAGEIKRTLEHLRPANLLSTPLKLWRSILRFICYHTAPVIYLRLAAERYHELSFLYDALGNQTSRDLLIKLFAYRILGYRKVKLPRNTPQYWKSIASIEQYKTNAPPINITFMGASLAQYDLQPFGFALKTYATPPGAACAFIQRQYEYHQGHVHCKAESGDIAIDAGGCWGETTMYFAHEVGSEGKVIAFEFIPSNLAVMQKNIEANPFLASRITLIEQPVWEYSGLQLHYIDKGPASRVLDEKKRHLADGTCKTMSIDDMVGQQKLPRVDFIKMDIEGAEFPALKGAEKTIRAYRPKLAISLYHQLSDFINIPRWLHELNLGYAFYLEHHTIHLYETVLFAIPCNSENTR